MKKLLQLTLLVLLPLTAQFANADIDLVIDKSGEDARLKLVMAPFEGNQQARHMQTVIRDDLKRSGEFSFVALPSNIYISPFGGSLNPQALKATGAEFLLRGKTVPVGQGFNLEVEIIDINNGRKLTGFRTNYHQKQRRIAHQTADAIYKQFTGIRGAFDTRIAYVASQGAGENRTFKLIVADADGHDPQTLVTSNEPIMSTAWGPQAQRIAYVSFESGRSAVFVQDVMTGERRTVSARRGINGSPAWSKNGRQLALSLSVEGNPEIYTLDLASGNLTRLTNSRAIDTEPSWTADGHSIVFTSDRGGNPQLYKIAANANGGKPQRLTFEGKYNSAPSIQGKKMAMIRQHDGKFQVALMDLTNRASEVISRGSLDESPSIAPNGGMVLYETRGVGRKHVLAVASGNGLEKSVLHSPYKNVGHPSWSPFLYN